MDEMIPHNESQTIHYCIALPKLTSNGLPTRLDEPIYCIIDSEWMDIVPDKDYIPHFVTPTHLNTNN